MTLLIINYEYMYVSLFISWVLLAVLMSTVRTILERLHCTRLAGEFTDCSYLFISILNSLVSLGSSKSQLVPHIT